MAPVYARANPAPLWRVGRFAAHLVGALAFEEGPAVLSRFPILASQAHRLSGALEIHERRMALEAVLEGPAGRFRVFSVHLTARSPTGRARQIAALIRAVEGDHHGGWPTIVGGDFNADEDELRLLTDVRGWIDSFRHLNPDVPGHTWGQLLAAAMATAGRRIDFLFSVPAGDTHWHPAHSRLVLDRSFPHARAGVLWASDHYGVLTDFEGPNIRQNRVP